MTGLPLQKRYSGRMSNHSLEDRKAEVQHTGIPTHYVNYKGQAVAIAPKLDKKKHGR